MDLKLWMCKNKITIKKMAALVKCSPNYLALIRGGKAPSIWLAREIVRFTYGEVTEDELRPSKKMIGESA